MKYVNLVYDDELSDVDILLLPDLICDNIEQVVSKYNDWLSTTQGKEI